jgi:hypothetical protein
MLGGSLSMLAVAWARRAHAVEAAGAKDRVRVVFHVPEGEGAATGALTADATNASLGIAEKLLGVPFRRGEDVPLAARFARLETRDDRNKLSALLTAGSVDVFLVTSLRDVDDPRLYRRGVTWTHYATPKAIGPYIVLAEPASPSTLAHELGHFFGLRHVPTKNNLMSYDRSEGDEFLDERQLATVKGLASARLKSKWLVAVP